MPMEIYEVFHKKSEDFEQISSMDISLWNPYIILHYVSLNQWTLHQIANGEIRFKIIL